MNRQIQQTRQEIQSHTRIALESIRRAREKLVVSYLWRVVDGSGHGDNFRNIHINFVDANDEERKTLYGIVRETSSSGEDFVYVAKDRRNMKEYHERMLRELKLSRYSFHFGDESKDRELMEVVFAN